MLNRIRNGIKARRRTVDIPASNLKKAIAEVLQQERYIHGFLVEPDDKQGILRIQLRYLTGERSAITGLARVSKPGLRWYVGTQKLARSQRQMETMIVSTSQGVMTSKKAGQLGIGGEALCRVW